MSAPEVVEMKVTKRGKSRARRALGLLTAFSAALLAAPAEASDLGGHEHGEDCPKALVLVCTDEGPEHEHGEECFGTLYLCGEPEAADKSEDAEAPLPDESPPPEDEDEGEAEGVSPPDEETAAPDEDEPPKLPDDGGEPEWNEITDDPDEAPEPDAESDGGGPFPGVFSCEDGFVEVTLYTNGAEIDPETAALSVEYAEYDSSGDDALGLELTLFLEGEDGIYDLSGGDFTAEITLLALPELLDAGFPDAAPEAETGAVFSVSHTLADGTAETVEAGDGGDFLPSVSLELYSPTLYLSLTPAANPGFEVEYYADIALPVDAQSGGITVIDTSGARLPQNGVEPETRSLALSSAGGGRYRLRESTELREVYARRSFEYIKAPNLSYFNALYGNGNYRLREVWVSQDGESWEKYGDPETLHFTNRADAASDRRVLISEGCVLRLVFDTTRGEYENSAAFYDYDISDSKRYSAASASSGVYTGGVPESAAVYYRTARQGINSPANYAGDGARFGFGNSNTGSGLSSESWKGSSINRANAGSFAGCAFGLTSGIRGGVPVFSEGIDAPDLFSAGSAVGKTVIDDFSLAFLRDGDTYTLTRVSGTTLDGLESFYHPGDYAIWTNGFWPLDSIDYSGHDYPFGAQSGRDRRFYFGEGSGRMPVSDDGEDHNSYFGMQYAVNFTLSGDYVGPLEYYFFGDDDMWVFLDDTLVCDIGGVHSSVGEYVDLWDYLSPGDEGEHTLRFFYTERGASGSTCFMRFTLPSVSSAGIEQQTGSLRVDKAVEGPGLEGREFDFEIFLFDERGESLPDDYSYSRYSPDGELIESDVILHDGGFFRLGGGEYIVVKYLPYGTCCLVTEAGETGCTASVSVNGGERVCTNAAELEILPGEANVISFLNSAAAVLPETGGSGSARLAACGAVMLLCSAAVLRLKRRCAA